MVGDQQLQDESPVFYQKASKWRGEEAEVAIVLLVLVVRRRQRTHFPGFNSISHNELHLLFSPLNGILRIINATVRRIRIQIID